jgi:ribosomal protein S18 acetylase RimI-like enzyme
MTEAQDAAAIPLAKEIAVRPAGDADLEALIDLEQSSFAGDRITRRSWLTFLRSRSAEILIGTIDGYLSGAIVLLFNRASWIARIYSIAVDPAERHRGLARVLLDAALVRAEERDCSLVRLETRIDNLPAQQFFSAAGFRVFGTTPGYYEDGAAALRLERSLWTAGAVPSRFPHYVQTLDFTCGPAALMMAMGALCPQIPLDQTLEIRLWREATTVFMAAGHGGCGPYGLALAAHRRGFAATIYVPDKGPMFVDSVRASNKNEVIARIEAEMLAELAKTPVRLRREPVSAELLRQHLGCGEVPIVLISLYRLHGHRGPHWVTVTGFDGHVFRVHDPIEPQTPADPGLSISRGEFERITRYGRNRQTAAVIIARSPQP